MRIDGLPNLQKVSQPNPRADAAKPRTRPAQADDSVEISSSAQQAAELSQSLKAAAETANPRLDQIRQRVQAGYYESDDIRRQIADSMLQSDGLRPVMAEVSDVQTARREMPNVPDVRPDRVAESRQRVSDGFYDQPEVRTETAQSIIDESA